ncbi:acyl carrier protein [Streptomyces albulus]|nr:acyl carrier protein [Streptomyces noursei]
MPADQVDVDESFERYGIDSLLVMSLTRRLEEHFGPLSKTLFFEYLTVRELAGYFTAKHPEALAAALGTDAPGGAPAEGPRRPPTPRTTTPSRSSAWPVATRRPTPSTPSGATCARAPTASRRCRRTAGTTPGTTTRTRRRPAGPRRSGAASCPTRSPSTRCSSGCPRPRPTTSTPRSGCSSRRSGTCWRTPATPARRPTAAAPACSSA